MDVNSTPASKPPLSKYHGMAALSPIVHSETASTPQARLRSNPSTPTTVPGLGSPAFCSTNPHTPQSTRAGGGVSCMDDTDSDSDLVSLRSTSMLGASLYGGTPGDTPGGTPDVLGRFRSKSEGRNMLVDEVSSVNTSTDYSIDERGEELDTDRPLSTYAPLVSSYQQRQRLFLDDDDSSDRDVASGALEPAYRYTHPFYYHGSDPTVAEYQHRYGRSHGEIFTARLASGELGQTMEREQGSGRLPTSHLSGSSQYALGANISSMHSIKRQYRADSIDTSMSVESEPEPAMSSVGQVQPGGAFLGAGEGVDWGVESWRQGQTAYSALGQDEDRVVEEELPAVLQHVRVMSSEYYRRKYCTGPSTAPGAAPPTPFRVAETLPPPVRVSPPMSAFGTDRPTISESVPQPASVPVPVDRHVSPGVHIGKKVDTPWAEGQANAEHSVSKPEQAHDHVSEEVYGSNRSLGENSPVQGRALFGHARSHRELAPPSSSQYAKYNTPAADQAFPHTKPHSDPTAAIQSHLGRRYNALCVDKPDHENPFPYLATLHYQQYCSQDVSSPTGYATAPSTPATATPFVGTSAGSAKKGCCRGTQTPTASAATVPGGNDDDTRSETSDSSYTSVYYSAPNTPIATHMPIQTPSYKCGSGGVSISTPVDPLYRKIDVESAINKKIVDYTSLVYSYRDSRFWQRRLIKHGKPLQSDIDAPPANPLHYYTPIYRKTVHFMSHSG